MWTLQKYQTAALRKHTVSESSSSYSFPYSERHLQCVWFDSALRPKTILNSENMAVTIENPGRWNLEAGPDFLDAQLTMAESQETIRGDVEIHISPHDWIHHKHSEDQRYNNVIAHVTYFPCTLPQQPDGVINISLKNNLQNNPQFSFESIDITAYPYSSITKNPPPCARILREYQLESFDNLLNTAGHTRIRHKTERIQLAIDSKGLEQAFYEEVMCALGYKNNRSPFRQLAQQITLDNLKAESGNDVSIAYAFLLGIAGLLPDLKHTACEDTRSFIRLLWDHWWRMKEKWAKHVLPSEIWCHAGLRPQNQPTRRLAAAAAMFAGKSSLIEQISGLHTENPDTWYKNVKSIIYQNSRMPFWENKLSFDGILQNKKSALIGPQRIAAITSNVIIPFIAANKVPVEILIDNLPPEQDHTITRQAAGILLGPDHNPALYNSGLKQQGLIQIFHDFCLNNRDGCEHCSLANALQKEHLNNCCNEEMKIIKSF